MNLRIGPSLVVIAIGAIFAFAISPSAIPGLRVNVAGIIVLLVGIIALVLSWRSGRPSLGGVSPWLRPPGHDDPRVDAEKRAAAADDATIREDDRYFQRPRDEDDL